MKSVFRALALVTLILFASGYECCPHRIENPAACKCFVDAKGKTICNSACAPGRKS